VRWKPFPCIPVIVFAHRKPWSSASQSSSFTFTYDQNSTNCTVLSVRCCRMQDLRALLCKQALFKIRRASEMFLYGDYFQLYGSSTSTGSHWIGSRHALQIAIYFYSVVKALTCQLLRLILLWLANIRLTSNKTSKTFQFTITSSCTTIPPFQRNISLVVFYLQKQPMAFHLSFFPPVQNCSGKNNFADLVSEVKGYSSRRLNDISIVNDIVNDISMIVDDTLHT
jgi:hypothetical protein